MDEIWWNSRQGPNCTSIFQALEIHEDEIEEQGPDCTSIFEDLVIPADENSRQGENIVFKILDVL